MPSKEIKELRKGGKLEEALAMAKAEFLADPENIWPKRNISWVYYEYLKVNAGPENFDVFLFNLNELKKLQLPEDEKMLFDNVSWQIGKLCFALSRQEIQDFNKVSLLLQTCKEFHFTKPSESYSFLFKAFHKGLKDSKDYIVFADWWDFKNFMPEDYQKEKMQNGKEMMSIVEQAYIAYAKHLLPRQDYFEPAILDKEKVLAFMPSLDQIIEEHPEYQYPPYFKAKLLLSLGDEKENMLAALLPFAKKKRNDFWVWEILAEAFSDDKEKVFAFYCRALSCNSPEEMLVKLRQKMAALFVQGELYNEAKTEIEFLVKARTENEWNIPNEVVKWQSQEWYKNATANKSNFSFYRNYFDIADAMLFSDQKEEMIFVDFVNTNRKILNFITSDEKVGFFKYDRLLNNVGVGDILKVRFQDSDKDGRYKVYTAAKHTDDAFKKQFFRDVKGRINIPEGKDFGFINDAFVSPEVIRKRNLENGLTVSGQAIKSFNKVRNQLSWKML